ncbi:serine hydrolase domain-containing protein [Sphingomonas asaccharolytica]|uniref:serine hydrolase domain-containing protein n=1 Tax=Sphingomonas asaccharolytica TaxID=40681 RepID=UPI000830410A|nr:serine hydrolase domain-containing protein [Sphingomonas asaccharolytica]
MRLPKLLAAVLLMTAGVGAFARAIPAAPLVPPPPVTAPAAAPPLSPGAHALTREDLDIWLDGYLPYALHSGDIAGAVIVVVKDGKVLTERGFGYADVARRVPVDPQRTLFRPGSVSKLFTWTAVMQLVEQHKLDLDRDVNAYLDFKIPPFEGKPVTLRNLMTHTGGFAETSKNVMFYDASRLQPLGVYLKEMLPARITAPGLTPAYSNYGCALAGYIVERASGESFDAYVERRIFAPLGMRNSTFRQPLPARFKAAMSLTYPSGSVPPTPYELVGPAPAGALASTGDDMGRFMIAHLQDGMLDGNRILQPATAEQMHNSPLTLLPPLNRMELGFFETNINGREVIAHLGDTQAFHTALHLFLKEGIGFYVSFNSLGHDAAAAKLRSALFEDFADRYLPGAPAATTRVDAKLAAEHVRLMAGNWVLSRKQQGNFLAVLGLVGQLKVTSDAKGGLSMPLLKGLDGAERRWVEVAPFVWNEVGGHERVAAKVVDGKVVRFSIDGLSPFMVFDRVPASQSNAWLLPALYAALAILALTVLLWPIRALVRRRYGATLDLSRARLTAFRASRIAAGAILAVLVGWMLVISAVSGDIDNLTAKIDGWLRLLQVAGLFAFVGGFAVMIWNAWLAWRAPASWQARTWSLLLVFAAAIPLWTAIVFGLLAFTVIF